MRGSIDESRRTENGAPASEREPRVARRWRRRISLVLVMMLLAGVAGELYARYRLGLGDPPLSVADPEIEYLFKPNMTYHRFGNLISYNVYSMRSGPVTPRKTDPRELRVLVIGDSVVNGGAQTDDSQLCTRLLQERLAARTGRPVYVANISAGSWGPPNQLAYVKRFGWFDADVVVLVFSSHDYADAPTFEPMVGKNPALPDHRPLLALQEGLTRYLLPRLTGSFAAETPGPQDPSKQTAKPGDIEHCRLAEIQLIESARAAGAKVIVAQHLEQLEQNGAAEHPGHRAIGDVARSTGIEPVQLGPAFAAETKSGRIVYRDNIHPNAAGQAVMADVLLPEILRVLSQPATRPTTPITGSALRTMNAEQPVRLRRADPVYALN